MADSQTAVQQRRRTIAVTGSSRLYWEAVAHALSAGAGQVHVLGLDDPAAADADVVVAVLAPDESRSVAVHRRVEEVAPAASLVAVVSDPSTWSANHPSVAAAARVVVGAADPPTDLRAAVMPGGERAGLRPPPVGLGRLTSRETEVLRLTAAGTPAREVAGYLGISPETVRTHLQSCMAKFDVHSRSELVSAARSAGLEPQRVPPSLPT